MSDLGAGIALNEDFDFEVDGTGDLRPTSGLAELQKDIAFNVASALQSELGRRVDSRTRKRINLIVQNQLIEDSRIGAINNVDVRELPPNDGYEVVADVDTVEGPFQLVFEVDL